MRRCKQNSKHANMPSSLHRIQQSLYSSAFSFFLGLSHFILIPPVCFFYHLSFCVFLSLLPICACLLLPSLFCFVYLSLWPFQWKILSPPWFPVFNGCGFRNKHEWGTGKVLYTGENPSQRVRKDYKREQRLRAQSTTCMWVVGFKKKHFNSLCTDSEVDYRPYGWRDIKVAENLAQ